MVRCEWMIGRGIGFLRGSSSSWCVRCSSHGWPSVDSGLRAAATRFFPLPPPPIGLIRQQTRRTLLSLQKRGMAFLAPAMAAWTKPRTLQQQQQYERSLDAESSLQPPAASTRRWDVLMIAVDDLRSELSCSGPKGFDTHAIHTPHLCDLAQDSLMLLRSQVRPRTRNHASRPHATRQRTHDLHILTP